MNRSDFQRNFQWSFFGLIPTPKVLSALRSGGYESHRGYDLSTGYIIPAYQPQVNAAENSMYTYVVLKTDTDEVVRKRVHLPWFNNCDEDSNFMHAGVPSTGMIQGMYSAAYVSRVPARDTPRGFSAKYSRVTAINPAVLRSQGVHDYNEDLLVWRIYNKVLHSWDSALEQIDNGELLGAALDKFLAVGVSMGRSQTQIFYKASGAVGYVEDGVPYVYPDSSTYSLREYIRKIAGIMPEAKQP